MPRHARIVIPDLAHHVTQRGNYRQRVFRKEVDYRQYCRWMNEYAKEYTLNIAAYCLMGNHVHFIAVPRTEDGLARTFNTVHMRYSQYMNRQKKMKGHLWQGRFFSCVLDDAHLYRAVRYVERNPVRAKMVKEAWEYEWSSARAHVGQGEQSPIMLSQRVEMAKSGQEWKQYLQEDDEEMVREMRLKTQRGLVVGMEDFIKRLEKQLDRSLQCLNPGRPRKARAE